MVWPLALLLLLCPQVGTLMEATRTCAKPPFVNTLKNTFFAWNKPHWLMQEKVTIGLIAGTVYINNMPCHQHNFTLAFSLLCFFPLWGLSATLLKIPVISAVSHSRLLSINSSSVTASNTSNTFPSKQACSDFIQAHKCAPNPKSPSPSPARQRLQTELRQNR